MGMPNPLAEAAEAQVQIPDKEKAQQEQKKLEEFIHNLELEINSLKGQRANLQPPGKDQDTQVAYNATIAHLDAAIRQLEKTVLVEAKNDLDLLNRNLGNTRNVDADLGAKVGNNKVVEA